MSILDGLNAKQREAVEITKGPVLIIAGAGSGKTRALTYKVAYLLEENICKPWEILVVTFTNKAAKEMIERVQKLVPDKAQDIWIGTFHSICVRILKREIELLGYTRDFNIADEQDKDKVIKMVLKKLDIDEKRLSAKSVGYEISSAKDKLKTPKDLKDMANADYRMEQIADVYTKYQEMLKKNNTLDFDDIIMLTVELFFKHPERLEYYQNKFKQILVDEYQDTNHAQFMLISMLSGGHGNISVVGDESQSIYGFRGADISNILEFENTYKNSKVVKLEQNYRSTKTILDAANAVIKNNNSKIPKKLWTENDEGEKIVYFEAENEYQEAEYIVDNINRMVKNKKFEYSDFVILYRTNAQSRVIEEMFVREGTPYKLIGGLKFYSRKEIKDVLAYLKLVSNIKDNVALARIINEPKRGIGQTSVENMQRLAEEKGLSVFEYIQQEEHLIEFRAASQIKEFKNIIETLSNQVQDSLVSVMIAKILKETGYEAMLKAENSLESQTRLENIAELVNVAIEFEQNNAEHTISDFLDSIALVADVDNLNNVDSAVTLMTMHNAKGLEYPVIFVVGMEEGLFPSERSKLEENGLEEERRLCYVALTRAEKRIFLTNAKVRMLYGSTTRTIPSCFIEEIPQQLMETPVTVKKESTNNYAKKAYSENTTFKSYGYSKEDSETYKSNKPNFGVDVGSFLNSIRTAPKKQLINSDDSLAEYVLTLKEGTNIKHKKFGEGNIYKIEQDENNEDIYIATINFTHGGVKRLIVAKDFVEVI